jgi:cell wall-associated NlpC family hydrolase
MAASWIARLWDTIKAAGSPHLPPAPELAEVERAQAHDAAWAEEVVRRALSCVGTGIYGLGKGGRDPKAPSPLDAHGLADCSAFLAWAWGESRYDPDDGEDEIGGDWIYTDALEADAKGRQRFCRQIAVADVLPGDGLVYGAGAKVGHCAIVVAVPAVVRRFADLTVVHCHGPSGKGPAITRANGGLWDRKGGIAIRRVGR